MSQSKYNKMQLNPFKKEWEKTGIAILSEGDAKILNESMKQTGIKYEPAKKITAKK